MRFDQVIKVVAVALVTVFCASMVMLIGTFEKDGKIAYRFALAWYRTCLWISGCRVRVSGLENVDPSRQYVFMANHRSKADIVALGSALRDFQIRWVAKKELLRVPFFGWGLLALKNIIVDRSNREAAIKSYQKARARISRGISVLVFPEGTRSAGDEMLPFKKGGFVFALETDTPIVPVALRGTEAVQACRSWAIEPGEVEVVIGKPIEVSGRSPYNKQPLMEEVRAAISAMIEHGEDGVRRIAASGS